jgi:hypothetical protein
MSERPEQEPVASLGEEVTKLLAALQQEHLATGSAECRFCPLCRLVLAFRETNPEVRQHLATAATSLLHAASGLLATHVPDQSARRGPVERIDLTDDAWDDDE